jgi:hypothetical protein
MDALEPYRQQVKIVRVEECESCERRTQARTELKRAAKEAVVPRVKLVVRRLPWMVSFGLLGHYNTIDPIKGWSFCAAMCIMLATLLKLVFGEFGQSSIITEDENQEEMRFHRSNNGR